ncbi:hypothetical protein ES703_64643 [subsurface metagenome]
MIVDAGDVEKMKGAFQKLDDAVEKLCEVWTSPHTTIGDGACVRGGIEALGATKLELSRVMASEEP